MNAGDTVGLVLGLMIMSCFVAVLVMLIIALSD